MSSKDYKKIMIESLLKKYHNRYAKNINTNRRIILKPSEIYKNYTRNNAEIMEKQHLNEAISELLRLGFVTVDYLKFSEDVEKIYLSAEKLDAIYEYLKEEYAIIPQSMLSRQVKEMVGAYLCKGEIVQKYCNEILTQIEDPRFSIDAARIEANLKMLDFLEKNNENLYVREVSTLVYGDSKWFERNNYDEICAFLGNIDGLPVEEGERNDAVLGLFHVAPAEQEIFIKGAWKLEWNEFVLETAKLRGGVAIATSDIEHIQRITVNTAELMTIENKTSYQRMKDDSCAMMYLGGFANRHQLQFLKKVIHDNPDLIFRHFGDIDIGGFLIHRHLCRETNIEFLLYCMGIPQLKDERFQHCLKKLTDNDMVRLEALANDAVYREVLMYMKEHNVKMEQEIISYYLNRS